jgi:hypothetical protein
MNESGSYAGTAVKSAQLEEIFHVKTKIKKNEKNDTMRSEESTKNSQQKEKNHQVHESNSQRLFQNTLPVEVQVVRSAIVPAHRTTLIIPTLWKHSTSWSKSVLYIFC